MEFSKLAGPPPPPLYFGKLSRMTHCFDLWRLKIRGVTFNDSLFWSGVGEGGGGGDEYEIFSLNFFTFQVKLIILGGTFFTLTKIIIFMEWLDPRPPPFWKIP